jgi:hypothetical protein
VLLIPTAGTVKMISMFNALDDGTLSPKARDWLLKLALLYPVTSGLIPLLLILRYAGAL